MTTTKPHFAFRVRTNRVAAAFMVRPPRCPFGEGIVITSFHPPEGRLFDGKVMGLPGHRWQAAR
jgi:hypothetical protein